MPELPEVETIRLGLEQHLVGKKIEDVEVRLSKIVQGDVEDIVGTKVTGVRRFGKGLVIDLDNKYSIAFHVKLTGQIIYQETNGTKVSKKMVGDLPGKFTHVIFELDKGARLYYNDIRQFGWIRIVKTDELTKILFFKELASDFATVSQSGELRSNITIEQFSHILSRSGQPIKVVIMDQQRIGGIGNIYANDALWDAKIDPKRKASSLTDKETEELYNSLIKVLKKGFQYGGASELRFVNALGQEGEYQKHFLAYAQKGKPCKRCGETMKKEYVGGRGSFYCSRCQK